MSYSLYSAWKRAFFGLTGIDTGFTGYPVRAGLVNLVSTGGLTSRVN